MKKPREGSAPRPTDDISAADEERMSHWEGVYSSRGPTEMSWFQATPTVSLELLDILGVSPTSALIDVGGGASVLVDHLLERGFEDVSVLDVSAAALQRARSRLAPSAPVAWLHGDVLSWRSERRFDLWHDRAVFHFLTDHADRSLTWKRCGAPSVQARP